MQIDRGTEVLRESQPNATLETTNAIWPDLGLNQQGGNMATNCLSSGRAKNVTYLIHKLKKIKNYSNKNHTL
jgi:hypothetical protein